jgi:organic hydroperoxide reductase OsmC/OhrA
MQAYPHVYTVMSRAEALGPVDLSCAGLPTLSTAPPPEFDGPGGMWSPETLLVGAMADCFILMFRAVARASKLDWTHLDCRVDGKLERVDGATFFTHFTVHAVLRVPEGSDLERARALLDKADKGCLVSNSLKGQRELKAEVRTA